MRPTRRHVLVGDGPVGDVALDLVDGVVREFEEATVRLTLFSDAADAASGGSCGRLRCEMIGRETCQWSACTFSPTANRAARDTHRFTGQLRGGALRFTAFHRVDGYLDSFALLNCQFWRVSPCFT